MAKLDEVAALAGVSKSVASRALRSDPSARVSQATRERVQQAAILLKYVPDQRSRALRTARIGAIGLVIPDVNNAVFKELLAGVQQVAEGRGASVLLSQNELLRGLGGGLRDLVGTGRVDGVIFQRPETMSDDLLRQTIAGEIPVVLFSSALVGHPGSVVLDDQAAVRLASEHLIAQGHRDIAFIGGAGLHDAARRRLHGFIDTLNDHTIPLFHNWIVEAGWEAESGRAAMAQLLRDRQRPTAVVVASVNAALGAHGEAQRHGIDIPRDISIIGIQDSWMAQVVQPELTVVRLPLREAGAMAADMLMDCLDGRPLANITATKPVPELVLRGSTREPGGPLT